MFSKSQDDTTFDASERSKRCDYQLSYGKSVSPLSRKGRQAECLTGANNLIVVIENRALIRECLARCLSVDFGCSVDSFPDVESWSSASSKLEPSLIIVSALHCFEWNKAIGELKRLENSVPVVVLSDADDLEHIAENIRQGARGHIPTHMTLPVAIEAMRFVQGGGVFVPADGVLSARRSPPETPVTENRAITFTRRQSAVLDALRQGKPNKLIAFELNMSESTVKVHVHNIMKKVQAKNRTEVAIRACQKE
jgi:DNA-binding NarL/FixJ family response regulator